MKEKRGKKYININVTCYILYSHLLTNIDIFARELFVKNP